MGNWSSPHGFIVEVDDHRNWNLPATLFVNDDERFSVMTSSMGQNGIVSMGRSGQNCRHNQQMQHPRCHYEL